MVNRTLCLVLCITIALAMFADAKKGKKKSSGEDKSGNSSGEDKDDKSSSGEKDAKSSSGEKDDKSSSGEKDAKSSSGEKDDKSSSGEKSGEKKSGGGKCGGLTIAKTSVPMDAACGSADACKSSCEAYLGSEDAGSSRHLYVLDSSECTSQKCTCTFDLNECHTEMYPCAAENSACENKLGAKEVCTCKPGYEPEAEGTAWTKCIDVNECVRETDSCHMYADCTNTIGSFTCKCRAGFEGDGVTCKDIDECAAGTDSCHANADCTNTIGSYTCKCKAGFEGNGFTCTDIDECVQGTDNCHSTLATCTNNPGSFDCNCNAGYEGNGVTCTDVDECTKGTAVCDANANCNNNAGGYSCACKSGYEGDGKTCTATSSGGDTGSGSGSACSPACGENAQCQTDKCVCKWGFTGDGTTCTPACGFILGDKSNNANELFEDARKKCSAYKLPCPLSKTEFDAAVTKLVQAKLPKGNGWWTGFRYDQGTSAWDCSDRSIMDKSFASNVPACSGNQATNCNPLTGGSACKDFCAVILLDKNDEHCLYAEECDKKPNAKAACDTGKTCT